MVVGSSKAELKVDAKLLLRSEILCERLSAFRGTHNIRISVPETTSECMGLYLDFIHIGPNKLALPQVVTKSTISNIYTDLANIYVVSQGLRDEGAKNNVAMAILSLSKIKDNIRTTYPPCPTAVYLIYTFTDTASRICPFLVDLWTPVAVRLIQDCKPLPKQLINNLLRATLNHDLDPKSLHEVLVAVMGVKEVQELPNKTLANPLEEYYE